MNAKNIAIFNNTLRACRIYKNKMEEYLDENSRRTAQALTESRVYKDEEQRFQTARSALAEETRKRIRTAAALFGKEIETAREELKTELMQHLAEPCNPQALATVKAWKDFDIVPARSEIEAVLGLIKGNPVGLEALNRTLKTVKSPLTVKYRRVQDYEADLNELESLKNLAYGYCPVEYHSAACDVFGGQQIEHKRPDGSTYTDGRTWDSIALTIQRSAFNSAFKRIEDAAPSWSADVSYTLSDSIAEELANNEELQDELKAESSTEIAEDATSGIVGRVIEQTAQNQAAAEVVEHYSR